LSIWKENDELNLLIETYEATMVNAIGLRSRIKEIITNQEYNDENMKHEVLGRMKEATEKFTACLQ
jgi:hypothetical protein